MQRLGQLFPRRLLVVAACLTGLLCAGSSPGSAQDTLRAAAVVNDEVISLLDLEMRTRLSFLLSGLKQTPETRRRLGRQVLSTLINERLRVQEAERLSIVVAVEEVDAAIAQFARSRRVSAEEFYGLLLKQSILPSTMFDQARADILWQRVVARRYGASVQVAEEEIDEAVARIEASQGRPALRLSEIFLPVDRPNQQNEVRDTAQRLIQQIDDGADFAALARQFSQAATASVGGDRGWVRESQLPDELAEVVQRLQPGQIAGPIETFGGYYVLLLRDQRVVAASDVTVNLKQILFAVPAGAPRELLDAAAARAAEVRVRVSDCADMDVLASEVGSPGSGDLGNIKLSELPDQLRQVVGALAIGQPSPPARVSGGVSLLAVCDRQGGKVDREAIREDLFNQRIDLISRRYQRDLRRSANVDIRL